MPRTQQYAEKIVDNFFDDKDVGKVIDALKDMGVDITDEYDVADNFQRACESCGIYLHENLLELIDGDCIYYSDCIDIIQQRNYWSGWNELEYAPFDNICQVAYAILEQEFYDEDGMEVAGKYFFNEYLN